MKFKILSIFLTLFIFSFILVFPALALSSDFLQKATKYYQENCFKSKISASVAISCYLFEKVAELEVKINDNSDQINNLDTRLTDLESSPSAQQKEIKTYDNNDTELGIYVDTYVFFYPPLERFVSIRSDTGSFSTGGLIYFTDPNCLGDPYKTINNQDMTDHGKFVFNAGDNRFFVVDSTAPNTSINTSSHLDDGSCINSNATSSQRKLREVSLSLPNPVTFPLHYKYN